jgi:hypothetical protein
MPAPLQLLPDPIPLSGMAVYLLPIIREALAPARNLPAVSGWLRGMTCLTRSKEIWDEQVS